MRAAALVAITAVGLAALTGVAAAKTVTDPNGRVIFDAPNNWSVSNERVDGFTHIIVGVAAQECQVLVFPSENLRDVSPRNARRTGANNDQFTAQFWTTSANAVGPIFPNNSAQVQSTSRDDTGFWPIQRAEIRNADRLVHASLTLRPGLEIYSYCMTYEGADAVAPYETLSRSIRHSNDAAWQAEAERQQAEHDASQAAAAAAQPQQQQQQPAPQDDGANRRRRN